jgi:hypothetical protein
MLLFFHAVAKVAVQLTLISAVYILHGVPHRRASQTSYRELPKKVLQRTMTLENPARFLNHPLPIFDHATTNTVRYQREIFEHHISVVDLP